MKKLALALAATAALGMAAPNDAEAWGYRYGGWGHRGWGGVGAGLAIWRPGGRLDRRFNGAGLCLSRLRLRWLLSGQLWLRLWLRLPSAMAMDTPRLAWWSFGVGLSLLHTMVATTRPGMAMAATTAGMASAGWATTAAITGPGWRTMADMVSVAWATTAAMASVVATASALVEWAAGAEPRRVVLESIETPSREGSGTQTALEPRYPSRRGFFVPSGTFVNLEG